MKSGIAWGAIGAVILSLIAVLEGPDWIAICLVLAGVTFMLAVIFSGLRDSLRRIIVGAVLIFFVVVAIQARGRALQKELSMREGALVPAGEPMPRSQCGLPEEAVAFFFGRATGSVVWTLKLPRTIVRIQKRDLLIVDRDNTGGLLVSARVFDDRGDILARIDKNVFTATPAAYRMERPDRSSLILYDHRDERVLDVRFASSSGVVIKGTFRTEGAPALTITDTKMHFGGLDLSRNCIGLTGTDDQPILDLNAEGYSPARAK